jgi:hypothetical protein
MAKTDRLNDAHHSTSRFFPPDGLALHMTEPPRPRTRRLLFFVEISPNFCIRRAAACRVGVHLHSRTPRM